MELHVNCKENLRSKLAMALPEVLVRGGRSIDYSTLRPLFGISESLPRQVREEAERWISSDPFFRFVNGRLSELIYDRKPTPYDEKQPLVNLPEFTDAPALADSLLSEFLSLPWKYTIFVPLSLRSTPFTDRLIPPDGLHLSRSLTLVQGRNISPETFPVLGEAKLYDYANVLASLYEPGKGPYKWREDYLYLRAGIEGFVADYATTTPVENLFFAVRSFAGLGLATGAFIHKKSYSPYPLKLEVFVYGEPEAEGESYALKRSQELAGEYGQGISDLQWDERLSEITEEKAVDILKYSLAFMIAAFEADQSREPLRRAGQWYFDSLCGSNELLSFVQAMVSIEILLGDKETSKAVGLSQLLANRCAYLLGKSSQERAEIIEKFAAVYDTRSQIVHSGKNRLSAAEKRDLLEVQWMARRVIFEELRLMVASRKDR